MAKCIAVLASGTGSIFRAMLEQGVPVSLLIADRACHALEEAEGAEVPCILLPRTFDEDFDRNKYTERLVRLLKKYDIDLVVMAGFRTILSPYMFQKDTYRLLTLNTHPSLLPAFKGKNPVKDALKYGVKVSGCTIHFATEVVDDGHILAQEPVRVLPGDTVDSLHNRIKETERIVYPRLIKSFLDH